MTPPSEHQDPFTVVAAALACHRESLSLESGMYKTHGWDSFGHITIIMALETAYGISIPNDELLELNTIEETAIATPQVRSR